MKFANIEGEQREAEKGLSAKCLHCGADMIAKCGPLKIWHWAHKGRRTCDPWWENETKWHRAWKNEFPKGWQEFRQTAENGEWHVADVKSETGWVLEFQHSYLKPEEREAREAFYKAMVWIVDGTERKRDATTLLKCILQSEVRCLPKIKPQIRLYETNDDVCMLLRKWNACRMPVYFDFGDWQGNEQHFLWRRDPINLNGKAYFTPVRRNAFVKIHREDRYTEPQWSGMIKEYLQPTPPQPRGPQPPQPRSGAWGNPYRRHRG